MSYLETSFAVSIEDVQRRLSVEETGLRDGVTEEKNVHNSHPAGGEVGFGALGHLLDHPHNSVHTVVSGFVSRPER